MIIKVEWLAHRLVRQVGTFQKQTHVYTIQPVFRTTYGPVYVQNYIQRQWKSDHRSVEHEDLQFFSTGIFMDYTQCIPCFSEIFSKQRLLSPKLQTHGSLQKFTHLSDFLPLCPATSPILPSYNTTAVVFSVCDHLPRGQPLGRVVLLFWTAGDSQDSGDQNSQFHFFGNLVYLKAGILSHWTDQYMALTLLATHLEKN